MRRPTRRQLILAGIGALVILVLVLAFLPDPVRVQTATAERGPLQVIVEEEGETRLEDLYVVTAPVPAYARRIELEVGDRVAAGQELVRLEPPRAAILDPRARQEAAARVEAARASINQAEAAASQAAQERARLERLVAAGAATPQALEQAIAEARRSASAADAARAELLAAQAALAQATNDAPQAVQSVLRAPVAGRVLAVHRESAGPVSPGEPLLEIGDADRLAVRVDVLSQDAVRITPGTRVMFDQWGGDDRLEGFVTHLEPRGFTRVSALGVEERRVTVRADVVSPPAVLGPGYRVLARFVVWEGENVLQVPTASLFRVQDGWALFVVEGGRAVVRPVQIGQQAGLVTEIVGGLTEGETVIVHPPTELDEGDRVREG